MEPGLVPGPSDFQLALRLWFHQSRAFACKSWAGFRGGRRVFIDRLGNGRHVGQRSP